MPDNIIWDAVQEGGFAALCAFLIWYTFKTTGEREKSFRERESSFIELMRAYAEQMKSSGDRLQSIAGLLENQTRRIEELGKKSDELHDTVNRWIDRRMREQDDGH